MRLQIILTLMVVFLGSPLFVSGQEDDTPTVVVVYLGMEDLSIEEIEIFEYRVGRAIPFDWIVRDGDDPSYEIRVLTDRVQIQTCRYTGSRQVQRVRLDAEIVIINLESNSEIVRQLFTGYDPAECPSAITSSNTFYGRPDDDEIYNWLQNNLGDEFPSSTTITLPHNGIVVRASMNPNGTQLLTWDVTNTVYVWNPDDGSILFNLSGSNGVFSPDGSYLAATTTSSSTVVFNTNIWEEVYQLDGSNAAFSPDGLLIATARYPDENTVQLWDATNGELISIITPHEDVTRAYFNPNGQTLVTLSLAGGKIWDLETSQQLGEFSIASPLKYTLHFSPNGELLTLTSNIYGLDGELLTPTGDNSSSVINALTGERLFSLLGSNSIFSPDGTFLVTYYYENGIPYFIVWSSETGERLLNVSTPPDTRSVGVLEISPDNSLLLSKAYAHGETVVQLWDLSTGELVAELEGHEDRVFSAIFSPNGQSIVTTSFDNTSVIWDISEYLEAVD